MTDTALEITLADGKRCIWTGYRGRVYRNTAGRPILQSAEGSADPETIQTVEALDLHTRLFGGRWRFAP